MPFHLVQVTRGSGATLDSSSAWVLLAAAGSSARLCVNGREIFLGIHVLRDRDELRWGGSLPLYFSDQRMAVVEPYSNQENRQSAHCARCTGDLKDGQPCVRCPNPSCGAWHHQADGEEKLCWTYAEGCASCGHPTDLSQQQQWSPELLFQS